MKARKKDRADLPSTPRAKKSASPIGDQALLEVRNTNSSSSSYYDHGAGSRVYAGANWRDRPPGMISGNERDKRRGNAVVVSIRLTPRQLVAIDQHVEDSIGAWPPLTRSKVITAAVESWLADRERERKGKKS